MDKFVVELFAGVGGFRVGLNKIKKIDKKTGKAIENGNFKIVWADQWEPSTVSQPAYECYKMRFGEDEISNEDITKINKKDIPDHTLLVGGFPCQDYSVAHSLTKEKGIEGKKGVLWWDINEILEVKKPKFVLLENVDRLIKSPAVQRGRDFGIMLRCFENNGYIVEWRVINAADYGHAQRRKRLYIFAYQKDTELAKSIRQMGSNDILTKGGVIARTFPVEEKADTPKQIKLTDILVDLVDFSNNFSFNFENTGVMIDGVACTAKTNPIVREPKSLSKLLEKDVDEHYYLSDERLEKFNYLRSKKKILRTSHTGYQYYYSEGAMKPSDDINLPGRTMLTSEGSTNRSTHLIINPNNGRYRRLTPVECERLNEFPDNWTDTGMSEARRYFMMGNALVCGVIEKFGETIDKIIDEENKTYEHRDR